MTHTLVTERSGSGFCGHEYCPGNCYTVTYSCSCGEPITAYSRDKAENAILEHRLELLERR